MGHPRRISKKYSTPKHPWRAERIQEEKGIERKYGLKNKKEIWKAHAALRAARQQARKLLVQQTKQAEIERVQLIARLVRLGILKSKAVVDDILVLNTTDFLDRRLQTVVHKLGLASTINQARQLIVHGHVLIKGKKVTVPSYPVRAEEETQITTSREFKVVAEKKPAKKPVEEVEASE